MSSNTPEEDKQEMTPEQWFQKGGRQARMAGLSKLKGKAYTKGLEEMTSIDTRMLAAQQDGHKPAQDKSPSPAAEPVLKTNPDIEKDIAAFRAGNTEFDDKLKNEDRRNLENRYVLNVMYRDGYQASPDTNIKKDIEQFRDNNPVLEARVTKLPRERIENALAMNEMKRHGYDARLVTVQRFFQRPENAEHLQAILRQVEHIRSPKFKDDVLWKEKAPNYAKAKGLKI